MEDKINFLRTYNRNVKVIADNDLIIHLPFIPEKWQYIFKQDNMEERIRKTLDIWKKFHSKKLRLTLSYLENNLHTVDLITYNNNYAILYGINDENTQKVEYYEGILNNDFKNNIKLKEKWDTMPPSIAGFYENIHNGFYYYPSHALGLVNLDEVTYFDDYDWEILEELNEPIKINLETTFGFFSSGGGGYVAIDLDNKENDSAIIWFNDSKPIYNVNFWDVVDEWILIGFQS